MRLERFWWFRAWAPIVVLALLSYASWAYCYELCYNEIYLNFGHESVAVGLMCGEVALTVLLIVLWIQMVVVGPGVQPKLLPFRLFPDIETIDTENDGSIDSAKNDAGNRPPQSIRPPKLYQCDPQGYPLWCSACQSIKANRTHHSASLGYCIPRFDHYCFWIGTVVGRKNYRLFVQFALYFWAFCIFVIASVASYLPRIIRSRDKIPRVNPNIIVTLALCCMATLMVGPLGSAHIYYMAVNKTSLEVIATKRRSKATKNWMCYLNPADGLRYVFEFRALDAQDYWNKHNALRNLKEFLGPNMYTWLLPLGTGIKKHTPQSFEYEDVLLSYKEDPSDSLLQLLQDRISQGDYLITFRAFGDDTA
ncbi:LAFA_0E13982g1_1 [Lachancea sp. 'fantastica']|nr:LAFA_0E13982g1_1 [Lachancea sp. 'fantastica']